ALLLSRLALQPPKLLHPRERKLRVGVAVTLLYNLSIQQGAILQEHISKRALVTVLVATCCIGLVKLQSHPLSLHHPPGKGTRLLAEVLHGLARVLVSGVSTPMSRTRSPLCKRSVS